MVHIVRSIIVSSLFQAHSKINELFNEADFNCAVSVIMTGVSDGRFPVVQKLREQLKWSETELFSFFEACSRKAHKTRR